MRDEIIKRRHRQWSKLHGKFQYCTRETPYSVTMDHKLYFPTSKKATRYAELCRRVLSRIVHHLHNRRLRTLKDAVRTWKSVVSEFNEKNLKTSHIEPVAENMLGEDEIMTVFQEQASAFAVHADVAKYG
jgi:hypothetical protein